MQVYEENLLFESLLESTGIKFKKVASNYSFVTEKATFIPPREIIVDKMSHIYDNQIDFLKKFNEIYPIKKFSTLLKRIKWKEELEKKYDILNIKPYLLNPNRQRTVFLEAPYSNNNNLGSLLKIKYKNQILSVFVERKEYTMKLNKKIVKFESDFFDNDKLLENSVYDDETLREKIVENEPKIIIAKNNKIIKKIKSLNEIFKEGFLEKLLCLQK